MDKFIASCVFTRAYPELSERIQQYIRERWQMPVMRCCVTNYKVRSFEEEIARESWSALPHFLPFEKGDRMIYLCHNCSAIFMEQQPDIPIISLWELILQDEAFPYPDHSGMEAGIQDCWRSKENAEEQAAVRMLLGKMNIKAIELAEHHAETDFCGFSLYQPAPPRNLKLAPKRFIENAEGKFEAHTQEEKEKLMRAYVSRQKTKTIVGYCHYCVDGLRLGDAEAFHIAELLFPEK